MKAKDPDALSAREWERLRTLEAECHEYRLAVQSNRGDSGWNGMRGWGGVMGVVMLLMMGVAVVAM